MNSNPQIFLGHWEQEKILYENQLQTEKYWKASEVQVELSLITIYWTHIMCHALGKPFTQFYSFNPLHNSLGHVIFPIYGSGVSCHMHFKRQPWDLNLDVVSDS